MWLRVARGSAAACRLRGAPRGGVLRTAARHSWTRHSSGLAAASKDLPEVGPLPTCSDAGDDTTIATSIGDSASHEVKPTPLSDDEFAAHLRSIGLTFDTVLRYGVAVAVSGGADSLGLCLLLQRWYDTQCEVHGISDIQKTVLRGITVDHGLRSESSGEALQVREALRALNFQHTIVKIDWEGNASENGEDSAAPSKNIHATARAARYDALQRTCLELGVKYLLVAHHHDDQCETVLQRVLKASGLAGLQGIPRSRALVCYLLLVQIYSLVAFCGRFC